MNECEMRYNAECLSCGQVFTPAVKSPLWWKAKQRHEKGLLDALCVTGEECGCVKPPVNPKAPFRVFGYDDTCRNFDQPFDTFVDAVRTFLELNQGGGYVVFIEGVSPSVEQKLALM